MSTTIQTTSDDHLIAWLAALAITIHILESALPTPMPGMKPGLANIVTVIVLIRFGLRTATWVVLLRIVAGSILQGTFLSPTFMLSLSGAVATLAILAAVSTLASLISISAIGYSILGAMAHMAGQFFAAYTLFIPHPSLFKLLPVLMGFAFIFGCVNGLVSNQVIKRLRH